MKHKRHLDRQRIWPVGECALCGAERYPGSLYWQLGGQALCEDCAASCLLAQTRRSSGEVGQ